MSDTQKPAAKVRQRHTRLGALRHGHCCYGKTTPEYKCWSNVISRCYRPNTPKFEYYGGRGIEMCDRWRGSFEAFLADMGPRPSPKHSIDRINGDGNYEPGNCRWATKAEQRVNQRPVSAPRSPSSFARGEQQGSAKMTATAVRVMRRCGELGMSQSSLAEVFPVSCSVVCQILRHKRWTHVVHGGPLG